MFAKGCTDEQQKKQYINMIKFSHRYNQEKLNVKKIAELLAIKEAEAQRFQAKTWLNEVKAFSSSFLCDS